MRHIAIPAATLAAILALAQPVRADMVDDCVQERDKELGISSCTEVIGSGRYSGKNLAWAYYNRGNAHAGLGDIARAIEDFDQALRLDPDDANAYNNRGNSYKSLGDYERVASDWDRSVRVGGAPRTKRWQKLLKGKGYYQGAIDGIYGPGTRRALLACARDPEC